MKPVPPKEGAPKGQGQNETAGRESQVTQLLHLFFRLSKTGFQSVAVSFHFHDMNLVC